MVARVWQGRGKELEQSRQLGHQGGLFLVMKPTNLLLNCWLIYLLTGAGAAAAEAPAQPPLFPDKKLEAAVRKYVFDKRDTDKPIIEADVINISTIEGKGLGITNLTGLEKCQSLASLDLAKNKIRDLSALQGFGRLQYLDLAENQVEDIAPLANVIALQYIELSHNRVSNIEPLRGLTNLASLYLSDNKISDLSPIVQLPRLVSLYLDDNAIKSIYGVQRLKSLSTLAIRGNAVCDLAPLQELDRLSWLFLERNKIRDITPLLEMARKDKEHRFAPFWNIYLEGNPLSTNATEQVTALKELGSRVHP
jgi:hypothetical protein